MIHIGYGDSATGCLNEAMERFDLPGEKAIPSRDDFTQGPIMNSHTKAGLKERVKYWQTISSKLNHDSYTESFYWSSIDLLNRIDSSEVTLWIGESCHDKLATGWLLSYLSDNDIKWSAIHLQDVQEKDSAQSKPAVNLAMYTPDKLQLLWDYRKTLSDDQILKYKALWSKASAENGSYRILKEDGIETIPSDYYDDYILSFLNSEFQEVRSVLGDILRDGRYSISDTTIEWNIKKLIEAQEIDFEGELTSMFTYKIRKV